MDARIRCKPFWLGGSLGVWPAAGFFLPHCIFLLDFSILWLDSSVLMALVASISIANLALWSALFANTSCETSLPRTPDDPSNC